MAAQYFGIANRWESADITDTDRTLLKKLVEELVGYPCKIACKENEGSVDIYVFSMRKSRVMDWLEIQPSGAIGVIFDEYSKPDSATKLNDACEDYNERNGVEFQDSDDEGDDDDADDEKMDTDTDSGGVGAVAHK
jgi:hypothetical protein